MKGFRHILIASAAIMAAAACTKTVPEGPQDQPMPIRISAADGLTKALLDNGAFNTTGNRIQVYDIYTASDNTVSTYIDAYAGPDVNSASSMHQSGTTWPFEDKETGQPVTYDWTPDGVHKFFGWLAKDANYGTTPMTPETFFGSGFAMSGNVLSIPEIALSPSSAQFDFLYSDIHVRNLNTSPDFASYVPLKFSHLFTAFSIGVLNTSAQKVTIKSFTLENIKNSGSATIDYSVDAAVPAVTYGATSGSDGIFQSTTTSYEVPTNTKIPNIFTGGAQQWVLMWPQAAEDLHSSAELTEDMIGGTAAYPEDDRMKIVYTVTDENGTESSDITKRLNFPDMDWEPGKKYYFDVTIADKMVELRTVVNPWQYEDQEIDFSDASVSVKENHHLIWDPTTAQMDAVNKYAYIHGGQPVKGSFTIDTPQGGTWLVSLTGDIDAFEVYPTSGLIDGTTATIAVKPMVADPQRDYTVNVKFAVRRPDGRVISADDALQPTGTKYTIVLSSN